MPTLAPPAQELHTFPLPTELEGVDLVDLSKQAQDRFRGSVAITPLERSETLSHGTNSVWLKRADLLPGGNFKFLSAVTTVAELVEAGHTDFTLATAGSYGIGVGHAIEMYGGRATAFVPAGSSQEKRQIMEELGVRVVEFDGNFDETNEHARQYAEEQGLTYVHPFASVSNMAGTGVLGHELHKQRPGMTHLVNQIGGASLHGGLGTVIRELQPETHIAAVQVNGCSPFVDSLRSGEVEEAEDKVTQVLGSYFKRLGGVGVGKTDPMTLAVGSRVVDSVHTVDTNGVYATMYDVQQDHGVLPEFAGAVGLEQARRLARSPHLSGAVIVAVLTGAHPDPYSPGRLERKSLNRQKEEELRRPSD